VRTLQERWREQLCGTERAPRGDATAWAIIDILPAHPMISAPVATAVIGRAKSRIYEGLEQLVAAGVLLPVSEGEPESLVGSSGVARPDRTTRRRAIHRRLIMKKLAQGAQLDI